VKFLRKNVFYRKLSSGSLAQTKLFATQFNRAPFLKI
jgi:hypothetical protein